MINCLMVSSINLIWIMTSSIKFINFLIGEAFHQLACFRMLTKKVFASVSSSFCFKILHFTINDFIHYFLEMASFVFSNNRIPKPTPNNLDNVPAGPSELSFQLLNYFSISSYRTIQSLKIAIYNKDQII